MLTKPIQRRQAPARQTPPGRSGAANDNARFRVIVPTSPARLARLGGNLIKLNPYLRLAGMALDVLELFQQYQGEGWDSNISGWKLEAKCASPAGGARVRITQGASVSNTVINLTNNCQGGQAYQAGTENNPFAGLANNIRAVSIGRVTDPVLRRARADEYWSRPSTGPITPPQWLAARAAIALPAATPSSWPLSAFPELAAPMRAPAFARNVPWRLAGKLKGINSAKSYGTRPGQSYNPEPGYSPQVPNDWSVSVGTGQAGNAAPTTHTLSPPAGSTTSRPRSEKERKIKLSPAFIIMLKAASATTEGIDFVNALYDALPDEAKVKFRDTEHVLRSATIQQKLQALYDGADKLDIPQAFQNLIQEQFQDYVYGKIGKASGEVSKAAGLNYGAGFASIASRLRKSWYDAEQKSDLDELGYH